MKNISNDSHKRFSHKRLAVILIASTITILLLSLSFSGLFASSEDSTTQPSPSPTPTEIPLSPTATSNPTPSPTPAPTRIPVPVDFTCSYIGNPNPNAFSVTVAVDLNDGMNREEAITVATAILDHELANAKHELRSAEATISNVWCVGFHWEYSMILPNGTAVEPRLGHVFDVTIYVKNRTVTYSRCM